MKELITGKDLIEAGYKPNRWFKDVVDHVNTNGLGVEGIHESVKLFLPPPYMEPFESALPYYRNLVADNDLELENLIKVETTMDVVMRTPTLIKGAIMPDACPAGPIGNIPVGGVVIARNAIHPAMHSADICCSVMITGFGNIEPKKILDLIHKATDFGGGPRKNPIKFTTNPDLLNEMADNQYFDGMALAMAKSHLGTQGDGNHFAFVGTSKLTGETCLVTHHGSRGVGAKVFRYGMAKAEKWRKRLSPNTNATNAWIPYNTPDGVEYWEALQLIRRWTKMNHEVLHDYVVEKSRYVSKLRFWNEHNFVFKKDDLFYHAKGSTPLLDEFVPDNNTGLRLIPLNMREPVLVVKGNITEENLGFAPHGAGRNMSRSQFKQFVETDLKKSIEGLDIRFYTGTADYSEYPDAYKNAQSVRDQMEHFKMGTVVDEIIPYGCIMAGESKKAWR